MDIHTFMDKLNSILDKMDADPENFDVEENIKNENEFWFSPFPENSWTAIAERFMKSFAVNANEPEYEENPAEGLDDAGKTQEDFENEYREYGSPNALMVFEYIFDLPKGCLTVRLRG